MKKNLDLKNLENNEFENSLMQKIENPIFINKSIKKNLSAKNARNTRILAKKYEIEKAIENLKIKNKTINFSDIVRESGVTRMTICKYILSLIALLFSSIQSEIFLYPLHLYRNYIADKPDYSFLNYRGHPKYELECGLLAYPCSRWSDRNTHNGHHTFHTLSA